MEVVLGGVYAKNDSFRFWTVLRISIDEVHDTSGCQGCVKKTFFFSLYSMVAMICRVWLKYVDIDLAWILT